MSTKSAFHDRLQSAAGDLSYREIGDLTQTHPETVRRYMQGQAPSAAFITNLCHAKGICGQWLLSGQGPMRAKDLTTHALKSADPNELMGAVANIISDLIERMDRMERLVQSLETRVSAAAMVEPKTKNAAASVGSDDGRAASGSTSGSQRGKTSGPHGRARRIGESVAERSSQADAESS